MKKVLVCGANGFVGKNLIEALKRTPDIEVLPFKRKNTLDELYSLLKEADFIYHCAGVNRPKDVSEFEKNNVGFTKKIISCLEGLKKSTPIVFTSSIQAELDNPYGVSQRKAEDALIAYSKKSNAKIYIYRLTNIFGKWSRPNYNSVVATFCHNIARGIEISISDPARILRLHYIDDVIDEFKKLCCSNNSDLEQRYYSVEKVCTITLGDLADTIYSIHNNRVTKIIPNENDYLVKCLHATYLSYLDEKNFAYNVEERHDARGVLCELLKSEHFGQIFISKSKKGVTRGNHYHDSKIEKFCVIKGTARISFRHILNNEVIVYDVSGDRIEIIDVPPGYTHKLENTGDELITLFWANEVFDADRPDTYFLEV